MPGMCGCVRVGELVEDDCVREKERQTKVKEREREREANKERYRERINRDTKGESE